MPEHLFRWVCPDASLSPEPRRWVEWVLTHLADAPRILCHPADLPLLQGTILAERVGLPGSGVVQRGTVWVCDDAAAV